ncbi:leucyl aminopeptidase [Romeria aff. gracilis LEGE 07310]|uniref:Probable cytosol aminopeptidase n=1 Tax=Vasconcelosia minhoensis LEGE 07310 TaxID=915328 RepID=A0A8J7DRY3_9CYAN|nr:leucyl aminopeptidase [Romeria gracilis]MBE9079534.1 leucyl aminopeptidase [Romeria aff. gracilis LEGE 07310]
MNFLASAQSCLDWSGDCLVIGLSEESLPLTGILAELNDKLSGLLQELIDESEFEAKATSTAILRVGSGPIRKLGIVGLGRADELNLEGLRQAAARAARLAQQARCAQLGISFPVWNNHPALTAQALVEGAILALYQDTRFKSEADPAHFQVEQVHLLELSGQDAAIQSAQQICDGVLLARQLVAAPPNVVTPLRLADTAAEIARDHGLTLAILERADCEKLGMGAYLGVAQASDLPPKFIHLTYQPEGTPTRKLAIIGKGLTFDSGGLNLKTGGSGIEMMKIDMGGAAAMLGAAKAVGQLKPEVEVHFISAATENMVSGHAMRPGDILTASNGKTIEVNNTDAEGRLTLADALVYAEALQVDAIVDLATLTGACVVALGDDMSALYSPDPALGDELLKAAEVSGEKVWKMPLEEKYFEGLKSVVADMKNTGPRAGGSITAALFLKQFIKETAWAHLDIAGPVWTDKENGYNSPGATGYGVRMLVQWITTSG